MGKNNYSAGKFQVRQRTYIGLTKKWGGATAAGFTLATTDATAIEHVAKHYPKGPMKLLKVGAFALATIGGSAGVDKIDCRFKVRGASASLAGSFNANLESQAAFGSDETMTAFKMKAGEYLSIRTGTPETDNGTVQNTATVTGTLAFFYDWVPLYDNGGNWDT